MGMAILLERDNLNFFRLKSEQRLDPLERFPGEFRKIQFQFRLSEAEVLEIRHERWVKNQPHQEAIRPRLGGINCLAFDQPLRQLICVHALATESASKSREEQSPCKGRV